MARLFGIHMIGLRAGVTPEDFETFIVEEVYPTLQLPGLQSYLLKGERGDREGKYLWIFEFDSVERRDHYVPSPEELSEEFHRYLESTRAVWDKWATLASFPGAPTIYTDYVVVDK
jgi:hypothetical protein